MREKKYLIKSYKQMFTVITVFTLVLLVGGVSIAFFNYTRTGGANTIRVGRISFNHTQDGTITLTNIFPMTTEEFENSTIDPSNNVTINIEGDTTYPNGIEYLVTAEDVHITVNDKRIPLTLKVTSTTDLGNNDEDYFTNRGGSTNIHKVLSGGIVVPGQYLVVGYIAPGQTGIDGSLNISAYINSDNIAISDTYDGTESDNMGTTNNWVNNRTVFTTEEWNSLSGSSNSLSFKIRVEANEGIWVDPYTTPNLMNTIGISRSTNIKEIRFIEETPLRMQRRYDASNVGNGTKVDLTYQDTGKVLAWIEPITVNPTGTSSNLNIKPSFLVNENTNNNLKQIDNETSYVLYIASSGKTKWVDASGLFASFATVEKITFENVDSSDATNMSGMFAGDTNLKEIIGLNKLDTSNITGMYSMFEGCSSLMSVDLSGMITNKVTGMSRMFYGCVNLVNVNFKDSNFDAIVTMGNMFYNCNKLESVIMRGNGIGVLQDIGSMFYNCSKLTNVDLSGLGGDGLSMYSNVFYNCTSLKNINMSNFNFGKINSFSNSGSSGIFYSLKEVLEVIDLSGANFSGPNQSSCDLSFMFYYFPKLISVDLSNANLTKVSDMNTMFEDCSLLVNVNFDNVSTPNIVKMNRMFSRCTSLEEVDLSGLGGNNLMFHTYMFMGCTNLRKINMSNFNFGNANFNGDGAFYGLSNVKTINLTNANISNLTNLDSMFYGLSTLTEIIGLNTLDVSNVTSMYSMFRDCSNLTNLDLSSFNTSNITNMDDMFSGCTNLKTISVSNLWNTDKVTYSGSMFKGCTSLVGGNGTVFDSTKIDKTMAVIDTAITPGYLTSKA